MQYSVVNYSHHAAVHYIPGIYLFYNEVSTLWPPSSILCPCFWWVKALKPDQLGSGPSSVWPKCDLVSRPPGMLPAFPEVVFWDFGMGVLLKVGRPNPSSTSLIWRGSVRPGNGLHSTHLQCLLLLFGSVSRADCAMHFFLTISYHSLPFLKS